MNKIINLLLLTAALTQAPFSGLFPGLNDLQMAAINQLQRENPKILFDLAFAHAISSFVGNDEYDVGRGLKPFMAGIFGTNIEQSAHLYFDQAQIQEIGEEQFYANANGFLN